MSAFNAGRWGFRMMMEIILRLPMQLIDFRHSLEYGISFLLSYGQCPAHLGVHCRKKGTSQTGPLGIARIYGVSTDMMWASLKGYMRIILTTPKDKSQTMESSFRTLRSWKAWLSHVARPLSEALKSVWGGSLSHEHGCIWSVLKIKNPWTQ